MGAEQWPPALLILPNQRSIPSGLQRIPVEDPQGLHKQEFTPIQHCPAAWSLLSLLHPMALLTNTQASSEEDNCSLPQSTPPASLVIQDAVWEGLISAVARAASWQDLQRETFLKMPKGSISILPFVLQLSLLIFPDGQVQGTQIQWTCCSIKNPSCQLQ